MLQSNQLIKKVYETGDKPVLVECEDFNSYVCKHNHGQNISTKLFAEWISHILMEAIGISVAPKELVCIKEEHIEASSNCQPAFFKNIPLFATKYLDESLELSQFNLKDIKLITNKLDLAKIAFFDLWLANEDRSWNNFNLLINPIDKGWVIVPIDHGACFNSLMFSKENNLVEIGDCDSLIGSEEFRTLVKSELKSVKHVNDFVETLYLRIPELEKIYDEQVLAIPKEWNIPKSYINALKVNLFQKSWLIETKFQFLSFTKSSLKLK